MKLNTRLFLIILGCVLGGNIIILVSLYMIAQTDLQFTDLVGTEVLQQVKDPPKPQVRKPVITPGVEPTIPTENVEVELKPINSRIDDLRNNMNGRLAAMENRLSTLKLQQDSLVMWAAIIFIVFAGGFTVAVAVLAMSLASLKARMDVFDRRLKDINELFKPLNDQIDKLKYRK